jgi:hypothetical protein
MLQNGQHVGVDSSLGYPMYEDSGVASGGPDDYRMGPGTGGY